MRKLAILLGICMALASGFAHAAHPEIDLSDYDDDLMRDLDKTIKYFEPDISGGNAQGALEDAQFIADAFKYIDTYFTRKGNADEAVQIARKGEDYIALAVKDIQAKDMKGASEAADNVARTCKTCHDGYRPAKLR